MLATYQGSVSMGRITGRGTMSPATGGRVEGNFVDGMPNGVMTTLVPNVGRLEAEITNGKVNGFGVLTTLNGTRYEGQFVNNVPVGPAVVTKNGQQLRGVWRDGCIRLGSEVVSAFGSPKDCPR